MIRKGQLRLVGAHARTLEAMWEQRRRWWFAHLLGDGGQAEAKAAAGAARLHHKLRVDTGLPDALIKQWEREWDDWFERKLRPLRRTS